MYRMQALTRRLQSWWTTAADGVHFFMTGWRAFWLRTETVMRSRLRMIWTIKSKLCYAKRQPKCTKSMRGARVMSHAGAHARGIGKTPAYWRVVFDSPPFNIVAASIFEALQ